VDLRRRAARGSEGGHADRPAHGRPPRSRTRWTVLHRAGGGANRPPTRGARQDSRKSLEVCATSGPRRTLETNTARGRGRGSPCLRGPAITVMTLTFTEASDRDRRSGRGTPGRGAHSTSVEAALPSGCPSVEHELASHASRLRRLRVRLPLVAAAMSRPALALRLGLWGRARTRGSRAGSARGGSLLTAWTSSSLGSDLGLASRGSRTRRRVWCGAGTPFIARTAGKEGGAMVRWSLYGAVGEVHDYRS